MKLKNLIKNLTIIKIIGKVDLDIHEIKTESKSVVKNDLFIAIKGSDFDGHDFAFEVEKYGAKAIVCEREIVGSSLTQIIVEDARRATGILASEFYMHPEQNLKVIGVVGTNGKTTTTHVIQKILQNSGVKCGVIGTLGVYYEDVFIEPTLTTPDPLELYKIFSQMVERGVKAVVMEVSAHAIYYGKVDGIDFEIGIFTNCTRDHLDFFKSMQDYEKTKLSFFKKNKPKYIVANSDDKLGREIMALSEKSITYGIYNPSDVFAIEVKNLRDGCSFVINLFDYIYNVKSKLFGEFNVYNILAGATAAALYGLSAEKICKAISSVNQVEGRLQCVFDNDFRIFIDYAHTPDGLEKSLKTLKSVCKGRLICVFGCGGNRDKGKREQMGRISGENADFTVITSDNPRYEEPMDIIMQIEKGMLFSSKSYVLVQDRITAIKYAIDMAEKEDVILIAGKGSEKYQEVLGIKHVYNDKDTVEEIIRG